MKQISKKTFQKAILGWYKHRGRNDLPWQQVKTPYHIWVSEIMLQQTQVKTVIPYYQRFLSRFQTLKILANASIDTVLQHWSGLGYYARARNLHQSAQIILSKYKGIFPSTFEKIISLPGIGRSTAGAILSFGFHKAYPILDGNIKRLLSRVVGITSRVDEPNTLKQLWKIAEFLTPTTHAAPYNQAMMDIGALICRKVTPICNDCPLKTHCYAYQNNLQDQIPTLSKPRKRNQKKTLFLICCYENKILLKKRPLRGIWGGLWSFPELIHNQNQQAEDIAKQWIKKNKLQLKITACKEWTSFIHTFTHFKLEITPVQIVTLSSLDNILLTDNDLGWFELQRATSLGLPSPTRKLLWQLQSKQNQVTI